MSKKTYIKGKDSDLESSIENMSLKLKNLGIEIESVSTFNPVSYVYSQHIRDKSCHLLFTNGKGSCEKSSYASALGEYFERLSCNYFFADYYLGEKFANSEFVHYPDEKWFTLEDDSMPDGLLNEELWSYYDFDAQLHPSQIFDTNSGAGERGICALAFRRLRDEKEIYFPLNFISNLYVSNGMSAGNTENEARVQAICEIYERYVKNKIIAQEISLALVPKQVISRYPHIQKSINELEDYGYHIRVADASLGGVFPVISVTLINPKNGSVFASFGSHPCFEIALERTVTELLQGRTLDTLDDFHEPTFNSDEVADAENLEEHFINATGLISYEFFKKSSDYDFVDWNFDSNTQDEFEYLSAIAHDLDFDIYVADYTHLGVYACRIIIPKMSEIYPVEDLIYNNNNQGAYYREALLSLKNLNDEDIEAILENLEEDEHSDMLKVAEFIGIIADEGSAWESLQIGELKAMLYLALKDYENAQEWVSWCNHIAHYDEKRTNIYRCLHVMLEIKLSDRDLYEYEDSLILMYSKDCVLTCKDIISTKERFYNLHSCTLNLEGFTKHQRLLDAYAKIHKAKYKG
jgi:ribosomal protein S12 methylthiotransferase accessory factor